MQAIDPYGSDLADYSRVAQEFGLEPLPDSFPNPNRLMRRGIAFAGRDLSIIARAIKEKKPYYVLSGIMPSAERIHLGTRLVVENVRYFQENGAKAFVLVADLEAATARGVTLAEARERALGFHIPTYIALGLDPRKTVFYFQSENKAVIHFAYEAAKKVTLNEFRAIYGTADPGRILSAVTQVGDMLFPQLEHPMPGVIPVGIDQDPHIRLARDVVSRMKERKFFAPSALYHRFTPSLDGRLKMSKSRPESCIELPEDPAIACRKVKRALTGGRVSIEVQKRLGGEPDKCMIFELYKQHLVEDDLALADIEQRCRKGTLLCGENKEHCCELMTNFQEGFAKNLEKAKKRVDTLRFVRFS